MPNRRDFFKLASLAAAGAASDLTSVANAFERPAFETLVPPDKKLGSAWIRSLFERGAPEVYPWPESRWIGMPIGGLCAGQLYLGGDGRLWRWDIFNCGAGAGDSHYAHPPAPDFPIAQGFAIRIAPGAGGEPQTRALDHTGWRAIDFRGEYPIGLVEYRDPQSPLDISLEAFSPFIPLNADESALPATIMKFTVKNAGRQPVFAELAGWMENGVALQSAKSIPGARRNRISRRNRAGGAEPRRGYTLLECSAEAPPQPADAAKLRGAPDFGTMGLALLDDGAPAGADFASASLRAPNPLPELFAQFTAVTDAVEMAAGAPFPHRLIGGLKRNLSLAPGQSRAVTFVIVWRFPNVNIAGLRDYNGRRYGAKFAGAAAVADHVANHFDRLAGQTRLWRDTWYDSTLPRWFLDRTFLNTSILATSTCYWLGNGRFYAWEGVGCCAGTCTHVWHYAHAPARLFPQLERSLREMVDYGVAFDPKTGRIRFRAEHNNHWAVDGQSGCILRTYREHQMSADDAFLRRLWPRVKKSLEFLIGKDQGPDGIIDGPQHNTLDADWRGQIAWLSGLYLAALRAGEEMAREMGDDPFARRCRDIFERGRRNIGDKLFNGEYFIQLPDPAHPRVVGSYNGCEIDQVMGQSWSWQVGLGRILDAHKVKRALGSLWRYNFTPDVGPYRAVYKPGRWYALAGDGGLIMGTWPRGEAQRVKESFDYYFNECMTGFEHQAAGHMIWEGMLTEGLAIERMIHQRYHASRRNPWNEVECGDHYARAMASYGVFLAACGYEHHAPKRRLAFAPRLTPDNFRCAFTTAEGWGTFRQQSDRAGLRAEIELKWGRLPLRVLAFGVSGEAPPTKAEIRVAGEPAAAALAIGDGKAELTFEKEICLNAGQSLQARLI